MKQRIGYLIDTNFEQGGAPISTKVLAEAMVEEYDVCVIKPYNLNENETMVQLLPIKGCINSVPYMLFHPIKWLHLCSFVERIVNESKCIILHAHMPNIGMALGYLRMKGKIPTDTKLVYTDREHVASLKLFHRIRYLFFIARQYDAIITLSEVSCTYWTKHAKQAKVLKIYNTASREFESSDFARKHNSPLRVIMVGRVACDKGWPLGIDIINKSPRYHYTLVMSYFDNTKKAEAEILLKDIKDSSNVDVHFNLSLSKIKELFQQSDILVMPSKRESFGRTAVEAMSQGCAVIATQVGGLPEVIGKPENCIPQEADAFCKRLDYYSKNPDVLEKDKAFFFQRYKKCFSIRQNIHNHCELYRSLL